MPHTYTRAAFASARASSNTLLALYCSLVNIEIALKDRANTWKSGHLIGQWLSDEADPGLTSLAQQLGGIFNLMCGTSRGGHTSRLNLDAYPEIRYLRHDTDYPGDSTDAQLASCLALVRDIEAVLRTKGIL